MNLRIYRVLSVTVLYRSRSIRFFDAKKQIVASLGGVETLKRSRSSDLSSMTDDARVLPVTVLYCSRSIRFSDTKQRSVASSRGVKTLTRFRSSDFSSMTEVALEKRQRITDERLGAAVQESKGVELKKGDHVMKEDSDSIAGEKIPTKTVEGKKNAAFEADGVPLHCTREIGNMTFSILCRKSDQTNVNEQTMDFWRKGSSYGDVLSYINYGGHGKVRKNTCSGQILKLRFPGSVGPKRYSSL